ncbi:hypothetical protein OG948_03615 [Embleya sp. NBC_00888]|uniref:hypothetical protein n=1 Tax=Embleya sp. NBC_00888 TaxID=2975960 RepID=UPI003868FECF|nr:hypothetical protein OG948_03615 [Embleya sp. NBC_00888]
MTIRQESAAPSVAAPVDPGNTLANARIGTADLVFPLPIVFCAGLLMARHIRRTDPERYALLTTTDVERD